MRAVFLSSDPDRLLIDLAKTMREKKHIVFIVASARVAPVWRQHGFRVDVPGRGWLPYRVNDFDASSYLSKRNAHVIVMNRPSDPLELAMANATHNRPLQVSINFKGDLSFSSDVRVAKSRLISWVRIIVKHVASRP